MIERTWARHLPTAEVKELKEMCAKARVTLSSGGKSRP